MICSNGFSFESGQCSLCPVGTFSNALQSLCTIPEAYSGRQYESICAYTMSSGIAVCDGVDKNDLQGLVVAFPLGEFLNPVHIAVDNKGEIFTSDRGSALVHKVTATGVQTVLRDQFTLSGSGPGIGAVSTSSGKAVTGVQYHNFQNVKVDSSGDVSITDFKTKRVRKITSSGVVITMAGGSMEFD